MKRISVVVLMLSMLLALCAGSWAELAPGPPPDGPPPVAPPVAPPGAATRPPGFGVGGPGVFRSVLPCASAVLAPPPLALIDHVAVPLGLTDEQKQNLKAELAKSEESMRGLKEKSRQATDAARQGLFAPNKDAATIKQLFEKAQSAEAALIAADLETWKEIRKILKPDQLERLGGMLSGPPRMRPGLGPGPGPGDPLTPGPTPPPVGSEPPPAPK